MVIGYGLQDLNLQHINSDYFMPVIA